jgi:hypothetical protein
MVSGREDICRGGFRPDSNRSPRTRPQGYSPSHSSVRGDRSVAARWVRQDGELATITARSWRAHTTSALRPAAASHKGLVVRCSACRTRRRWCDDVGRILGYYDVAEHEPSARPEPGGDAGEQVRLYRHHQGGARRAPTQRGRSCPRAVGPRDSSRDIGSGDGCGRGNKDLCALVDADQLRLWTDVEHPTGRLPPTPSSSTRSTWIPAVALPTASCSSSYAGTSARIVSR